MQNLPNLREICRICAKFTQICAKLRMRKFAKLFLQNLRKFARNLRPRLLRYLLFLSEAGRAGLWPAARAAAGVLSGTSDRNTRYCNKGGRKFRANLRKVCKNKFANLRKFARNFCVNFAQIRQISRKFGQCCMFPFCFYLHPRLLHPRLFRSN